MPRRQIGEALAYDMAIAMDPFMSQAAAQRQAMRPLKEDWKGSTPRYRVDLMIPGSDFRFDVRPAAEDIANDTLRGKMKNRIRKLQSCANEAATEAEARYQLNEQICKLEGYYDEDEIAAFTGFEPEDYERLSPEERLDALNRTDRTSKFIHGVIDIMGRRGLFPDARRPH